MNVVVKVEIVMLVKKIIPSPRFNEFFSCAFEFDRRNNIELEKQRDGHEGIQAMLQTTGIGYLKTFK